MSSSLQFLRDFCGLDSVRNQTHARVEIIAVDMTRSMGPPTSCRKLTASTSHLQTDQCAAVNSSEGHPVSRFDSDAPPSATRL